MWLKEHRSEARAAIILRPLVLQAQTTLPLFRSRASSLMHGASGIVVVMKLRTLMKHVTAYGVEWKRGYGLHIEIVNRRSTNAVKERLSIPCSNGSYYYFNQFKSFLSYCILLVILLLYNFLGDYLLHTIRPSSPIPHKSIATQMPKVQLL